jgi:hypothetical protein
MLQILFKNCLVASPTSVIVCLVALWKKYANPGVVFYERLIREYIHEFIKDELYVDEIGLSVESCTIFRMIFSPSGFKTSSINFSIGSFKRLSKALLKI